MKKARYDGSFAVDVPSLGLVVQPGDVIDVPDDFANSQFSDVQATVTKKTKESDSE
jgi:hypothetical protein